MHWEEMDGGDGEVGMWVLTRRVLQVGMQETVAGGRAVSQGNNHWRGSQKAVPHRSRRHFLIHFTHFAVLRPGAAEGSYKLLTTDIASCVPCVAEAGWNASDFQRALERRAGGLAGGRRLQRGLSDLNRAVVVSAAQIHRGSSVPLLPSHGPCLL